MKLTSLRWLPDPEVECPQHSAQWSHMAALDELRGVLTSPKALAARMKPVETAPSGSPSATERVTSAKAPLGWICNIRRIEVSRWRPDGRTLG